MNIDLVTYSELLDKYDILAKIFAIRTLHVKSEKRT